VPEPRWDEILDEIEERYVGPAAARSSSTPLTARFATATPSAPATTPARRATAGKSSLRRRGSSRSRPDRCPTARTFPAPPDRGREARFYRSRGPQWAQWALTSGSLRPVPTRVARPEDRELAERVLVAPLLSAGDEDLADVLAETSRAVFDFVIGDGVVLKETTLATWSALELLGPGDILAPPLTALRQTESRAVSRYLAHGEVILAALDERFRQAARSWPELSDVLHDRLGRQTHRASTHLAMLHRPRVQERVVALFADLAERFGRVTAEGIVVDVRLTHELVGRLVGSRRRHSRVADPRLRWRAQPGRENDR
jgi:CRP/FNR family transcriptional regulator, cyclic AMP receptor protein